MVSSQRYETKVLTLIKKSIKNHDYYKVSYIASLLINQLGVTYTETCKFTYALIIEMPLRDIKAFNVAKYVETGTTKK